MRLPIWQRAAKTPWAITEDQLQNILAIARRQNDSPEAVAQQLGRKLENTYAVEYRDGVAILNVEGPLFRYANMMTELSGATSYERIAKDFRAAIDNEDVRAVLLNIDSPGGEANGTSELADHIYSARGIKPIVAYVGGSGASGAYWIASAADEVVAQETAMLGSIGVRTALIDDSERKAEEGLREYVIVSSQSPDKAVDPSNESDRARVQALVDDLAGVFVSKVARNRGVSEDKVLSDFGQGDVMVGQRAVDAGLADRLGNFEALMEELSAPQQESLFEEPGMSAGNHEPLAASGHQQVEVGTMYLTNTKPAAGDDQRQVVCVGVTAAAVAESCPEVAEALKAEGVEAAQAEGASAERERIQSIISLEEAEGREAVAQQLAMTDGMTADNARTILAKTPKGNGQGSAFMADMDKGGDPDVGPDAGDRTDPESPEAAAATILSNARNAGAIQ